MTEYVSSTPQQFDTSFSLFLFQVSYYFFQVSFVFFDSSSFVAQVYIVEAVVFDTDFLHEFKTCIYFIFCSLYFVRISFPWEALCSATELVATFSAQCVPPCHSEFQPFFHRFAQDDFFCIIITESHRVFTFYTFKFDFSNTRKVLFCCHNIFVL